jgi:hypothetical protein
MAQLPAPVRVDNESGLAFSQANWVEENRLQRENMLMSVLVRIPEVPVPNKQERSKGPTATSAVVQSPTFRRGGSDDLESELLQYC